MTPRRTHTAPGRPRPLRGFLAGVALGLAMGLAMPAPAATTSPAAALPRVKAASHPNGVVKQAVFFGDSGGWEAQSYFLSTFSAPSLTTWSWSAVGGAALRDWQDEILAMNALPPTVPFVLELGGNDALQWGQQPYDPIPHWKVTLDQLATTGRCVVVLDLGRRPEIPQLQAFWNRLGPLLRSYGNVLVGDWWTKHASLHPEWYRHDKLHHTEYGSQMYSWAIWYGTQRCAR